MYGDLRSTKRAIAASAASHSLGDSVTAEGRLAVEHRVPRSELVEAVEHLLDVGA